MKQIIFKILTVAILSVFVLTLFCFDTILAANFTNNNSSSSGGFYMRSVSSDESVASSAKSEDNNPYTNPGESTTGFEQPSTNNDQNNDGTNDAFEIDNPADYQTMDGENDKSGGKYIYTLLQSLPKEGPDLSENVTIEEYLTWAFRFVLALAGFLAVMMIVIGGVEYIISGASEAMRGEAKKRIENAIWGLVMALVSYLVLYTINPSLVNFEDNCFFKECDKETTSNTETDVVFDVTFPSTETKECDFSSNGECYFKTNKYKEGDKEITQMMELPTVEGGVIQAHESYIDEEGTIFYRRGTVNTNGTITYTSEWKK